MSDDRFLMDLFDEVRKGGITPEDALDRWARALQHDVSELHVDLLRERRTGFPEVVYAAGKTPEAVRAAARTLLDHGARLLVTRAGADHFDAVRDFAEELVFDARARVIHSPLPPADIGRVAVVSAGTADVPCAEEAAITARMLGADVTRVYDVGVAGLHRLLARLGELRAADCLIVVAGMEGALPSVIGGLTRAPMIAVPTSVGYGAGFEGLAPLLAMLNSCAPGVVVVNIDNGFGAGFAAGRILRRAAARAAARDSTIDPGDPRS